ncbi:hypothetical protein HK405_010563, partial [Cladochytrium tenue]
MPTFAECTIIDTATGALSVYSPLLINQNQAHITPVTPTLTATSVVGCWFGTNGVTTTLADTTNGQTLAGANCVNGAPNSIFGQFAACNAAAFFTAAKNANLNITPLGTGKNGNPCYTTRSFQLVDMDPSDNVVTTYLVDANGKIAQNNAANMANLNNPTELANGSDNALHDVFLGPALGCSSMVATNLASSGTTVGALALNELQAAALQAAPVALVPPNDPMVLVNNNMNAVKLNLYRTAVNQGNGQATTAEATTFCVNYLNLSAPAIITDSKFTIGFTTPAAANGKDLYTFLGNRFQLSWTGLGCENLLNNVTYLNKNVQSPIISVLDGNGVTIALTYNTPQLLALAQQNGLVTASATAATASKTTTSTTAKATSTTAKTTASTTTTSTTAKATSTTAKTTASTTATTTTATTKKTSTSAAAASSTSATSVTGTTVTHKITSGYMVTGWCSGAGNFQTQLTLQVNQVTPSEASQCTGNAPMAECGLATFQATVTKNGAAVDIVSWNGGTTGVSANTFQFTETDDMPYYGGALELNMPCSYTTAGMTPADLASGIALSYTAVTGSVSLTLTNGGV